MWFFKKKNKTEQLLNNKHHIEAMAASVDVLISLGQDNEELVAILKEIQDKIKYFNPTQKSDVLDIDKKIENKLGDLKIDLTKAKQKGEYANALSTANEIKDVLVVERNSKANLR